MSCRSYRERAFCKICLPREMVSSEYLCLRGISGAIENVPSGLIDGQF